MKGMSKNWPSGRLVKIRATSLLLLTCFAFVPAMLAESLADFGYRRMTVNGKPAIGGHPLAVVVMEFAGSPPLAHAASYYDQLIFDTNQFSVNGYYQVNSHGRFFWKRAGAGTYGPFSYPADQYDIETSSKKTLKRLALAVRALAEHGFDFTLYDTNSDGKVTRDELSLLVVDNGYNTSAGNRAPDPDCYAYRNGSRTVDVCLDKIANVSHQQSFMTFAHELSHQLGTIEMYGTTAGENAYYTLMGRTMFARLDDMQTFHLDPWHKMMLGWIEPKIQSLDRDGQATLGAAQLASPDSSLILYSPVHGPLEFYLLEFRTNIRPAGAAYDDNVAGGKGLRLQMAGLVIWHIKTQGLGGEHVGRDVEILDAYDAPGAKMISAFMNGSPNFSRGYGGIWNKNSVPASGVIPYPLTWLDGRGRPVKIKVGSVTNNGDNLQISWGLFPDAPLPVSQKILAFNANGRSAATGFINDNDGSFTTLQSYSGGTLRPWTHVVGGASEVLFYNSANGSAALGQVDSQGNFKITREFRAGYFVPGWTHIVFHKGYYLFYKASTGAAVIGNFGNTGFRTYNPGFTLSAGWTNIVSTVNGLLFYNSVSGSGAVGDWSFVKSGAGLGTITQVTFNRSHLYGPGSFLTGWTHIVNTSNGTLFYCSVNGRQVMADVNADGSVTTRSGTEQTITTGWNSIVFENDNLLFYNDASGDVAIGTIREPSQLENVLSGGRASTADALAIRRVFPAYFSPGWTNIVMTVDPGTTPR